MTEKYGSGRFCSRSCANSRSLSEETKQKISDGINKTNNSKRANGISLRAKNIFIETDTGQISRISCYEKYLLNPDRCSYCNAPLPYERRYNSTCSYECKCKLFSKQMTEKIIKNGGNLNSKIANYKSGTYKGIRCDSSYELAFLVYNLENGINITRNTRGFKYFYNNEEHTYYPDFIVNDTYIELKNY